jgi:hypothetical protein
MSIKKKQLSQKDYNQKWVKLYFEQKVGEINEDL